MQKKNVCYICSKKFSRRWNLERHLYNVHEVHKDLSIARIKQEINVPDNISNMVEPNRKVLNRDNIMNHTEYNQSYYNNNNNLPNNLPYYYYGFDKNTSSHLYSNINSQYKEEEKGERRLSIDDKIKIQKVLKNLENYLQKFLPHTFIFQVLSWLRYQCLTQKSDEPLKKFLVKNNM